MGETVDIGRLEQIVERLLESYNALKREHETLRLEHQEKLRENTELQMKLAGLRTARDEMHGRVSGLIGKIEEWEGNLQEAGRSTPVAPEQQRLVPAEKKADA